MKTSTQTRPMPSGLKWGICASLAALITLVTTQTIVQAAVPGYWVALAQPVAHAGLTGLVMSVVQSL